jgi:NADH-quinone oxidoreductase subunit H
MPRLRIDQLLNFNWKVLTPIALALLIATALVEKIMTLWILPGLNETTGLYVRTFSHLALNIIVVLIFIAIQKKTVLKTRQPVASPRPIAMMPKSQG